MRIRCCSPASRRASRWVSSSPWGERRTAFPGPNRVRSASTPAKIGSGFITIPPPPPKGASSVTRCFPSAKSRRSCTPTASSPASLARARMLWSSGPEKIPGKSVRMSIRTLPPLRGGHHDAAARDVHLADELGNHRKEGLPLLAPDGEPVVSRPLLNPGDLPDADPRGVHHFAADQVRDVILPLLRGRKLLPKDRDQGTRPLLRLFRGVDPAQRKNGEASLGLGRFHLEVGDPFRSPATFRGQPHGSDGEEPGRVIRKSLHPDLPRHPVGTRHASHLDPAIRHRIPFPTLSTAFRNYGPLSGRFHEAFPLPVPGACGGLPLRYARDLRPLAAGSARRKFFLAPHAAHRNPPLRPLAPGGTHGCVAIFMK